MKDYDMAAATAFRGTGRPCLHDCHDCASSQQRVAVRSRVHQACHAHLTSRPLGSPPSSVHHTTYCAPAWSPGTGKSTTLRIAAGLLAPDSGEVLIMGQRRTGLLSDQAEEEPLRIGMVFQNAALFDSLTVGENVGFLLLEHSNLDEGRIRALVAESLARVGLPGVEGLYPAELSGGMKKRVALARAVVRDVRATAEQVIMYDEPTAGLDPVASTVVEDLMRDLHNKGGGGGSAGGQEGGITSYIVVTHQHSTIRRAVDRIIFLHKGRVVWEGSVAEFDTTTEPIVRQFAEGTLDGPIQYL
jgi:ABC-type transporter Mla maintaining outer membrane lipid asymmetry ATPase subunit MlaF